MTAAADTSLPAPTAPPIATVGAMRVRTLLGPLLLAGAVALARRSARPDPTELWVDEPATPSHRATPPPSSVRTRADRSGAPTERGRGGTVRMDLDRARAHAVEPVVEFLTYVQERRGDRGHLLFVRTDDLDAMAEASDEPIESFLSRLDQLGVVVSHN